jgi:porphyrinogen peroxidase
VVVQKYLHDLPAWNALAVEAQERVIGRTKLSDIELDPAAQPPDSHVARTTITDPDGPSGKSCRTTCPSAPWGTGEFGTYFIGYARTPAVTEEMLERMFCGDAQASHDRILDFSTPVTGTLFFFPSADFLDDLPDPPDALAEVVPAPDAQRPPDDSLGIGDLRERTAQ